MITNNNDDDDGPLTQLKNSTKNAHNLQLQTLQNILQRNAAVSYLRRYHPSPLDASTFRRAVPLSTYEDYADYINRLAEGVLEDGDHRPLLSVDPLLCFFFSSGTSTMSPKLIPYFDSTPSKALSQLAHQSSATILRRLYPPRPSINKILWFFYAGNVTTTKGGYKAMAATAFPFHGSETNSSRLLSMCISPKEVFLGSDFQQQLYCHLLCGLRHSDCIDGIRAPYAVGLTKAFSFLESKWEQLCDDIENGFPCQEVSDTSMRNALIQVLDGAQPDLSKKIRSILQEKDWQGILGKLWPNARYVKCVTSGSMDQYYTKLKYFAGELPLLGGDYFASECSIGINMDIAKAPELTQYVLLPSAAYFEFLPFNLSTSWIMEEGIVDISGVEIGKMYEMVVTTYRGLYRYRVGDIVKVVGFYNSSPCLEFVMRAPKTSTDIVTERDLISAMRSLQIVFRTEVAAEIVEFAGFLDLDMNPKSFQIFVEVQDGCILLEESFQESSTILNKCCSSLENSFGGVYDVMKARGEFGPLLISIVKPGSFDSLSDMAIRQGVAASQYKPPKIIRNRRIVELMELATVTTVCVDG